MHLATADGTWATEIYVISYDWWHITNFSLVHVLLSDYSCKHVALYNHAEEMVIPKVFVDHWDVFEGLSMICNAVDGFPVEQKLRRVSS